MPLRAGDELLHRYRVVRPLGSGGVATAYEVEDRGVGRRCALKLLDARTPDMVVAFRDEFALLAGVEHPHLTRVFDFGSDNHAGSSHYFYTAALVEGVTLERYVAGRPSPEALVPILDAVDALGLLHELGVRHGDVHPRNVLVDTTGRGVLIDLGAARRLGECAGEIGGVREYLAPELLTHGGGDARADLFAVGIVLQHVFGSRSDALSRRATQLARRLCHEDPRKRPSSAAEVLEAFGREGQQHRSGRARCLIGRGAELARGEAWLDALARRDSVPRVLALHGARGTGKTRLLDELRWRAELRLDVAQGFTHHASPVSELLTRALGQRELAAGVEGLIDAVDQLSARDRPLLLVLDDVDRLAQAELQRLLAFCRLLRPSGGLGLLLTTQAVEALVCDKELVPVPPLDASALRDWAGGRVSEHRLAALLRVTGGCPAEVEIALNALSTGRTSEAHWVGATQAPDAPLGRPELLAELVKGAEAPLRRVLALVLAADGALAREDVSPSEHPWLSAVLRQGWVAERAGRFRVRGGDVAAVARVLGETTLQAAHQQLAELARAAFERSTDPEQAARVVLHSARGGSVAAAARWFSLHEGAWRRAPASWVQAAVALAESATSLADLSACAECLIAAGQHAAARRALARGRKLRPPPERAARLQVLAAETELAVGRLRSAARRLQHAVEALEPAHRGHALERLARVYIQLGDMPAAARAAERGLQVATDPAVRAALTESRGVAALYTGDRESARRELAAAASLRSELDTPRERLRTESFRAIVEFRAGRPEVALTHHQHVLRLAEEHALDDALASACLNLGTAEQQLGEWGTALRLYERGHRIARAQGNRNTELLLEFNLANLYAEIGAFERAELCLHALRPRGESSGFSLLEGPVAMLAAELAGWAGHLELAAREYASAERAFSAQGAERELAEVSLGLAQLARERGELAEAHAHSSEALTRARAAGALDVLARGHALRARLRAAERDASFREELREAESHLGQARWRPLEVEIQSYAYECERTFGDLARAAARRERARRLADRLASALPTELRDVFWQHPRRVALLAISERHGGDAAAGSHPALEKRLRRLLTLNQRLNSSLSLERVLETTLDAAIDLTHAERGFLLLNEPTALVTPGASALAVFRARTATGEAPDAQPSAGIVAKVAASEGPVLTTDAQSDERFAAHQSVFAMRLKSVLCVPITAPTGLIGALYLDSRVHRSRFDSSDLELAVALADQAAIAITNARLHDELARKTQELEQQRALLERKGRGQARELERLAREVEHQRSLLQSRYDYGRLVARSPAMRAVLAKLERVIGTDVSVLVQGESGTGKELIARAIHVNSPRQAGPFVSINCAALPETLLESELFGHVRGAFTGADRDKPGLLVAARGGTLFLDELGEMALATQAKLLRVLQEREVRPVGASRSVPLDLRLVCATNRHLKSEVAAGRFREDLYYRVAVMELQLPPLRERPEDLPELAQAIVARAAAECGRAAPALTPSAMRALAAQPFPGNVRELENLLTRAVLLAEGEAIGPEQLELNRPPPRPPRSRTRREHEAEERERILHALRAANWNVSHVGRQLGIPRNTLYRKLARYGIITPRDRTD